MPPEHRSLGHSRGAIRPYADSIHPSITESHPPSNLHKAPSRSPRRPLSPAISLGGLCLSFLALRATLGAATARVSMRHVTKDVFLAAQSCMTQGWYLRHDIEISPPTEADLFRMEHGVEIGRLARSLFPQGILVPAGSSGERTRNLITSSATTVLFEAAFNANEYAAKADILQSCPHGWHVIEVKMSLCRECVRWDRDCATSSSRCRAASPGAGHHSPR